MIDLAERSIDRAAKAEGSREQILGTAHSLIDAVECGGSSDRTLRARTKRVRKRLAELDR